MAGFLDFLGPIAQTDPAARDRALSGIAASTPAPNMSSGGGGLRAFLGLDGDAFSGVRGAAGQIGDYLLQANGMQPIYAGRRAQHEKRQLGGALEQFLGGPDSILGSIAQIDPGTAVSLWKERQDAETARMKAQQPPDDPAFVRELNAFGFSPDEQREIARQRYSRPIIVGSPATGYGVLDYGAPDGGIPPADVGPQPGQVVNGFRFRGGNPNDRSAWEPVAGGAGGNAGGGFPGN